MRRKKQMSMSADERMKITIGTNKKRDRLLIELAELGRPLGQILFAASDVETLMLRIAEVRASMTEQVVPELEPVFRIATVEEPAWRVSNPMPDGRRILALRHPGFGWLGFVMRQDCAHAIALGLRGEPGASTKAR
jgi:hypothetical protein